jgi:hypothetical protein
VRLNVESSQATKLTMNEYFGIPFRSRLDLRGALFYFTIGAVGTSSLVLTAFLGLPHRSAEAAIGEARDITSGDSNDEIHLGRPMQELENIPTSNFGTDQKVTSPTVSKVAALIRPGYRAATIEVDHISGVEGWASAGRHVDLVMSYQDPTDGKKKSQIVVENALVLSYN